MRVAAHEEFAKWYQRLRTEDIAMLAIARDQLNTVAKCTSSVDFTEPDFKRIVSSRHAPHMWEIRSPRRPGLRGDVVARFLFVYEDSGPAAILLAGGNKVSLGNDWYLSAVPTADHRYDTWLRLHQEGTP